MTIDHQTVAKRLRQAICVQLEAHPQTNMLFGYALKNHEFPATGELF